MSDSILSPPDTFVLAPLLSLLPRIGTPGTVRGFQSSLFARHEHVLELQKQQADNVPEEGDKLRAEEQMLRAALDWITKVPAEGFPASGISESSAYQHLSHSLAERGGYSPDEITSLYALAQFTLENGDFHQGEILFHGLTEITPDFLPAWLGLACARVKNEDFDGSIYCSKQGLRVDPGSLEATLFLIVASLSVGDYQAAGTYLGEVGERLERTRSPKREIERLYKVQLLRYQELRKRSAQQAKMLARSGD